MRSIIVLAALAGCYSPSYQDCGISCAQSGDCPSGLTCELGRCRSASGLGPCMTGSGGADADIEGWALRKKLTFAPIADVTDYPALVRITDSDLVSYSQDDGGDIKFTTLEGIGLTHEVERYVAATGELVAWVRVPALSASMSTEIWMYFSNPEAVDQENPQKVWDANYVGVWHLSDAPGPSIADATEAARVGTKGASNAPATPTNGGVAAGGLAFTGLSTDYVTFGDASAVFEAEAVTFEAWFQVSTQTSTATRMLFGTPTTFATNRPALAYADVNDNTIPGALVARGGSPSSETLKSEGSVIQEATWMHLVMISYASSSNVTVYVNGKPVPFAFGTNLAFVADATQVFVGAHPSASSSYVPPIGYLDELRFSNIARTEAYAVAQTRLGAPGSGVLTVGPTETVAP